MLLCVHQRQSLAICIARALEKEAEEAVGKDSGEVPYALPDINDLNQFLRTVEVQTSSYPWRIQLDSFAARLEIEQSKM